MSDYRRARVAGGCYFFTVALLNRQSGILVKHVELLRDAVRLARLRRPFHIDAWVILPDHMHCIWTLPEQDADFSSRWRHIKNTFSRALPKTENVPSAWQQRGERGVFQRRFWEHAIRDERDYMHHFDYVHLNPYKHGLVTRVRDWPYSTFHRYVSLGVYAEDWLSDGIEIEAGERKH